MTIPRHADKLSIVGFPLIGWAFMGNHVTGLISSPLITPLWIACGVLSLVGAYFLCNFLTRKKNYEVFLALFLLGLWSLPYLFILFKISGGQLPSGFS